MTTGASLFIAAVGAILMFAVQDRLNGVDLSMAGLVLLVAGLLAAAMGMWHTRQVSGARTTRTATTQNTENGQIVTEEAEVR